MGLDDRKKRHEDSSLVLFSPPHLYLFNTLAVPQLTGYLTKKGCPVVSRVLDNEFYTDICSRNTLEDSLNCLEETNLPAGGLEYLADSVKRARLPQLLNLNENSSEKLIGKVILNRKKVVTQINHASNLLQNNFLSLGLRRFGLALAKLQLGVDFYCAPFWPSKFGILTGSEFPQGHESSEKVYEASKDERHNFIIDYYENWTIPSLPKNPLLVGVSITHESQIIPAFTLARLLKKHSPKSHLILGGATVSTLRDTLQNPNKLWEFYDSVTSGHGEEVLEVLYNELNSSSPDLGRVPKLTWKDYDGKLHSSNAKSTFTFGDIETPIFTDSRPNPIIPLMTSRGCDWAKCHFCSYPTIFSDKETSYTVRPKEDVLRDLRILTKRHNPTYFHLCDSNVSIGRVRELSDLLNAEDFHPQMYAFVRGEKEFSDKNFCRRVRDAGFFALHFGLESASQRLLNDMNKGTTVEDARVIIKNFFDSGILPNIFLIGGTPTETPEDRTLTVNFVKDNLPYLSEIAISRFYLDNRCNIQQNPEKYGIIIDDKCGGDLNTDLHFMFDKDKNKFGINPSETPKLVEEIYKRIGIAPSYGQHFIEKMVDYFHPETFKDKLMLYVPFAASWLKGRFNR